MHSRLKLLIKYIRSKGGKIITRRTDKSFSFGGFMYRYDEKLSYLEVFDFSGSPYRLDYHLIWLSLEDVVSKLSSHFKRHDHTNKIYSNSNIFS